MASSYVLLGNLKAGRCSNMAEVRLLRFWEARNVHKNNELMSVDLLLLDELNANPREHQLQPKFRLSDSPVSIRLGDGTSFEANPDCEKDIPTEFFRFRNQEQLLALANTNRELPGIIFIFRCCWWTNLPSGRLNAVDILSSELTSKVFGGSYGLLYPFKFRSLDDYAVSQLCSVQPVYVGIGLTTQKELFANCEGNWKRLLRFLQSVEQSSDMVENLQYASYNGKLSHVANQQLKGLFLRYEFVWCAYAWPRN
ncbi:uncharacterized protein LOC108833521 [Raphanus sativus]|uniref:Uncharacterized protein LOC108833521 n=1 Tax=Raphanus sativus TaxID=3726 RepID=A0A9W3DEV9_RAPSA|nr:uncharacterized protein LOC108833521 [Raphanus sativus]